MTIYYIAAENPDEDFNCDLFVDTTSGQKALDIWLPYARNNFSRVIKLCGVFECPPPRTDGTNKIYEWRDLNGLPDLLCTDADVLAYAKDLVRKGKLHSLHGHEV